MPNFKTILAIDTVHPLYSIAIINSNDVVSEISTKKDEKHSEQIIKLTPNIPIISEEEARERKPDYFLILPWAFTKEFVEREKKWREEGGKFIVPLPNFRVI